MTIFYDQVPLENNMSINKSKVEDDQQKSDEKPNLVICHFCSQTIFDQFYYEVDGNFWHNDCLRCNICHVNLTSMRSCFSKNKRLWCRQDYDRRFRCQKCYELLKPSDLIMRAGNNGFPYHVDCFRCDICNIPLESGDSYGCLFSRIFCKNDYLSVQRREIPQSENWGAYSNNGLQLSNMDSNFSISSLPDNPLSALCQLSMDEYIKSKLSTSTSSTNTVSDKGSNAQIYSTSSSDQLSKNAISTSNSLDLDSPNGTEFTSLKSCLSSVQKLHYESSDITSLTVETKAEKTVSPLSNCDVEDKTVEETTGSNEMSETDGKEIADQSSLHEASTLGTEDDDGSQRSCSDCDDKLATTGKQGGSKKGSNNLRQKRVRTSFKHQQLRTMKAYFAMNHNPDSKDLRQLSQKTGLSKRVLQVWFQNARAKFRRSLCRQSGLMCTPSGNQMQMANVFDESLMTLDKNGNFQSKSKLSTFTDIPPSILNHSVQNNHRMCNMPDLSYSTPNNNGPILPSLNNIRDRYLPNGKQFIPTTSFYNPTISNPTRNSPSLFPMDIGNLNTNLGLSEFPRENGTEPFHLTEIGISHQLTTSI